MVVDNDNIRELTTELRTFRDELVTIRALELPKRVRRLELQVYTVLAGLLGALVVMSRGIV